MTEKYGELPNSWLNINLGDLCVVKTGKKDVNEGNINGLYPFFTCAQEIYKFDSFSFEGDSILIAGNGNFNVKKYSGKFEAYQRTYVLQDFAINYQYLYYFIFAHLSKITKDNRGSTVRYIRLSNLTDYPIYVAGITEQGRIVEKIEELFSELDKGIETLKTIKQQLKVYRQSVLKWAFEGKLTEKWKGNQHLALEPWKVSRLGEYIEKIEAGRSFRCFERPPINDEVGVLKVSAVTWGSYNENECKTCPDISKVKSAYFVKNDDFLFSRANTLQLVGTCVIARNVQQKIMLSDKILRIKFHNITPKYCLYYLRSKDGRNQIEKLSTGNQESMRNIGQERIKSILINICPSEEQIQVVEEIESRFSICDKLEESIELCLKQADLLRQSILKKAFEGKLVPQDPDIEPAELLLERIRNLRAEQNNHTESTPKRSRK